MTSKRVLVAGIGNVFLGDDGFGVEVVARLRQRPVREGVEVADFGIRGFDLAYALMDGYDTVVLVDALPWGKPAGTVFVVDPDVDAIDGPGFIDSHAMNPVEVFRHVKQLGGTPPPTFIVGCQPATFGPEEEGQMALSDVVGAAVDKAVDVVEAVLDRITSRREVSA
jgi:hydrogenase maturation protease